MSNRFESALVFRPDVRVIVHTVDSVELRSGVWNCDSVTLSDDERKGILGKIVLGLLQKLPISEIAQHEGVSNEDVLSVIETLSSHDLLITKEHADTWSRATFLTTATLGSVQGMHKLPAKALLVGPSTMTDFLCTTVNSALTNALEVVEAGLVERLSREDLFLDSNALSQATTARDFSAWQDALVVAVWPALDPILLGNLNRLAHKIGFMFLSAVIDGPFVLIGPTVMPYLTPCFACAEARVLEAMRDHTLYTTYRSALAESKVHGSPTVIMDPMQATTLSLAAWEMTNMLSVGSAFTVGKVLSIYAPTMEFAFHELLRFPGCPVCSGRASLDRQLYSDLRSYLSTQLVSVPSSGSRKDIDPRRLPTGEVYPPNPNKSSGNALGKGEAR